MTTLSEQDKEEEKISNSRLTDQPRLRGPSRKRVVSRRPFRRDDEQSSDHHLEDARSALFFSAAS